MLSTDCSHAFCCAPAESTKGHNAARDELLSFTRVADPNAEPEVLGLIDAAPDWRPADILTTAAREGITSALDVGICSPNAVNAGSD